MRKIIWKRYKRGLASVGTYDAKVEVTVDVLVEILWRWLAISPDQSMVWLILFFW